MKKKCVDCDEEVNWRNRGDEFGDRCIDCVLKKDGDYVKSYNDWLDRMQSEEIQSLDDLEQRNILTKNIENLGPDEYISHDTLTEIVQHIKDKADE